MPGPSDQWLGLLTLSLTPDFVLEASVTSRGESVGLGGACNSFIANSSEWLGGWFGTKGGSWQVSGAVLIRGPVAATKCKCAAWERLPKGRMAITEPSGPQAIVAGKTPKGVLSMSVTSRSRVTNPRAGGGTFTWLST